MKKGRKKRIKFYKNNKGSTAVIVAVCMPIIIGILGYVIDMSFLMYSKEKLATATKFTAMSATAMYSINDEKIDLIKNRSDVVEVLHENYEEAELKSDGYDISKNNNKITCTIKTTVNIPVFFSKVFGNSSNKIVSSYTVTRKIKVLDEAKEGEKN
jgi:Flp pilus assembly protein TadG